ncbi:hypothetical protein P8936_06445 [Edaphobacter paludis]|uniref:Antitoxin Xre/MbcA/ParS-like toxin-binding domain-containing protein n=1 Tax=Edaphobacter paludis TaxID=3035702 RepID=A0AAU7DD87_9BACT
MEERSHPTTRYQPAKVPDYSSSSITERRRLTGPTLRRFFKIMRKWKVSTKDARLLLGGITSRRFKQLSIHPEGRILNQDQLLRATNVIAIDQSLHKLLPRRQADKWVQAPNRQFCGGTPLYNMVGGGAITLWEWRQSLDKQVSESRAAER